MCYAKATPEEAELTSYIETINPAVQLEIFDYQPFYHVSGFTHPKAPVLTAAEPQKIKPFIWGFIPHWSKTREDAMKNANVYLNTTCEKATSTYKPFFRQRCLVFVKGFFEWQWKDEKGKEKVPYFIHMDKPFALGGYYNSWTDKETGEVFDTYSVITTPANELMAAIHNNKKRMPLIVPETDWSVWLDQNAQQDAILPLLKPLADGLLQCHPISKNITKRGFDTNVPEMQEPVLS
jgi:putative SOS response-associated peptidase YedK